MTQCGLAAVYIANGHVNNTHCYRHSLANVQERKPQKYASLGYGGCTPYMALVQLSPGSYI